MKIRIVACYIARQVTNEITMTAKRHRRRAGARTLWTGLLFSLSVMFSLGPVVAQEIATEWVDGERHRIRLTAGAVPEATAGSVTAFIEMALDKGWKTYWRNPGTAGGIPPEFDWSKSTNIGKAEVLFPVPKVMSDKAGDVIGYQEYAIFPLRIIPADPAAAVQLNVTANYGICAKLCVPAETSFSLTIPPAPLPTAGPDAERAYAAVPRTGAERGPADPSGLKAERFADKPGLIRLSATFPGAADAAAMYLSVPDGRYLPIPVRRGGTDDGTVSFDVAFSAAEDLVALKGATVGVTMAGEKGQSDDSFVID